MRYPLSAILLIGLAHPGFAEGVDMDVGEPLVTLSFAADTPIDDAQQDTSFRFGGAAIAPHVRLGVSADEDRHAAYASAGFDGDFGEVGIGRPRSILDAGPLPDGAPGVPRTIRPLAAEAALNETLGAGVSLATTSGAISFGTSYHTIEQSNASVLGIAGRYDLDQIPTLDNVAVYGGAESDGDEQRFRLGTEMTRGIATAGVDLLRSNEDEGRTVSQIYFGLAVTPSLSLGVSGLRDTFEATNTTDTRFGLGASMATSGGAFLRGGIDGVTSDDPAFEVSVGFEF